MPAPQQSSGSPKGRLKLVLAIVLALAFVIVLIVQFGGSSAAKDPADDDDAKSSAANGRRKKPAAKPEAAEELMIVAQPPADWPEMELAAVLGYDPFAVPDRFTTVATEPTPDQTPNAEEPPQQQERLQRKAEEQLILEDLQKEGVDVILGTAKDGYVAVIGSQTIRVGDEWDGFRVIDVRPDGVVLERLKPKRPEPKPPPKQPELEQSEPGGRPSKGSGVIDALRAALQQSLSQNEASRP